jgi:hypothetical protein
MTTIQSLSMFAGCAANATVKRMWSLTAREGQLHFILNSYHKPPQSSIMEPQTKPVPRMTYQQKARAGMLTKKPRQALRKVAKGNAARMRKYKRWIREALFGTTCAFTGCGRFTWIEPHHPFGREGENLFKVIPMCHEHHEWIHAHSNDAYSLGWIQPELKKVTRQPNHPQPFTLLPPP